ncbi:30S ribosomal protein S1 [Stieleria varia]|uniref:30S ribosomal protein S1 n=1 Tax=Stieleria varia TaxID=2528005 RepID=A0A5C5ZQT5_9BACT|nr:S1 RNA-binding domain-containing protein [Stieleria varia]TWT89435.1 30S ribosomal protein S1 [Stieleria varia]
MGNEEQSATENSTVAPASESPIETQTPVDQAAAESPQEGSSAIEPTLEPNDSAADDSAANDAQAAKPASVAARGVGPLAARGLGVAKPASPVASTEQLASGAAAAKPSGKSKKKPPRPRLQGESDDAVAKPAAAPTKSKVALPSLRAGLSADLEAELEAELAAADLDGFLSGQAGMPDRKEPLADGARVHGQVIKIHQDSVFISLGGPDEGVVPFEQFMDAEPTPGQSVEVLVRGLNRADGLYVLSLPGKTIDVNDWGDLEEGAVVEAIVTGHNAGGLECKVGGVPGFMPISQVTEYRVEDLSEFVDQRFVCLVTEASPRRGNLVLSRRAILERERETKRKEQLEQINPGDTLEGVVRSVKDFGAFVDLGGVDGLIHVSKLSWDRVKHPSEVLEVGQKVKVKIDTIDRETGKIGLSYRDLLENPWDVAEAEFAIGSVHKGVVSRIASFGCFVRLGAGVEGLVHVSELAHHRVSRIDSFVSEGQEVEVKVLSFDRGAQKIGLSMKAAQQLPESEASENAVEEDEPQREPAVKPTFSGPLRGGNNRDTGGERFGLRW